MSKEDLTSSDFDFRPAGYTLRDRTIYTEYSSLEGNERINKVRRILIDQKSPRQWADHLACEELSESYRAWLGSRIHYFGLDPQSVLKKPPVIADIILRSTLIDSYWISAEKIETGYLYKISHNLDLDDAPIIQPFYERKEPLTLHELIRLIDESYIEGDIYGSRGLVKGMWEGCLWHDAPEEAVTSTVVDSIFYPDLERHYSEEGRRVADEINKELDDDI